MKLSVFIFFRKVIIIKIFDDEEYEKNEEFYLVLDEPCLLRKGSGTYIFICFLKVIRFILRIPCFNVEFIYLPEDAIIYHVYC